jgi:hypothetical protein
VPWFPANNDRTVRPDQRYRERRVVRYRSRRRLCKPSRSLRARHGGHCRQHSPIREVSLSGSSVEAAQSSESCRRPMDQSGKGGAGVSRTFMRSTHCVDRIAVPGLEGHPRNIARPSRKRIAVLPIFQKRTI